MRFLTYVSILILACCGAMRPARALDGTINLTSCACQITADFAAAARRQANLFDQNGGGSPGGNYIIASSSGAMSAAVSVTGHYVIKNQDVGPVWVTVAVTPIDSNGNSLAGQSEASLESLGLAHNLWATNWGGNFGATARRGLAASRGAGKQRARW
jgi:hypothetical protein